MDPALLKRVIGERGLEGQSVEEVVRRLNDPKDQVLVKKQVVLRDELALALVPAAFALADKGAAIQAKWDRIFQLWLARDSIPCDEVVERLVAEGLLTSGQFASLACNSVQRMVAIFGFPATPGDVEAAMGKGERNGDLFGNN